MNYGKKHAEQLDALANAMQRANEEIAAAYRRQEQEQQTQSSRVS